MISDRAICALLAVLNSGGEEARIVGGAVRDALMGRTGGDIDIATTALPQEVMARAEAAGWKTVPTGLAHGTLTVVIDGRPFEVTTLRQDVTTDGRRAVVAFTRDFRTDAYRRDFTINALSVDRTGTVHDYATGMADAIEGRVRFMGAPEKRISEDYLRILRFFRFHASHGKGAPDVAGTAACAILKAGMAQLSRERIRQELFKLLVAPGAVDCVAAMQAIDLWSHILPCMELDMSAFAHLATLEQALELKPDAVLRLAALFGRCTASQLNLKLSRQEEAKLLHLNQHATCFGREAPATESLRRNVFLANRHFTACLLLGHARIGEDVSLTRQWLERAAPVLHDPPRNPFRSTDALRLGVKAGPRMGLVLKSALALWLEAGLPGQKTDVEALLRLAVEKCPETPEA